MTELEMRGIHPELSTYCHDYNGRLLYAGDIVELTMIRCPFPTHQPKSRYDGPQRVYRVIRWDCLEASFYLSDRVSWEPGHVMEFNEAMLQPQPGEKSERWFPNLRNLGALISHEERERISGNKYVASWTARGIYVGKFTDTDLVWQLYNEDRKPVSHDKVSAEIGA